VSLRVTWLCWLLVAASLGLAGCAKLRNDAPEGDRSSCPDVDAGRIVDPALLAFLSRARAAHHMADRHEENKSIDAALRVLDELISGPRPGGKTPLPEVREVLADTHARLADLRSQRGQFAEAARDVAQGLELAAEPSYFRGHLFETRGLLEERRAKSLTDQGKSSESAEATRSALAAFEESMRIQAQVIDRTLHDGDAG
jgi:hypothetical protein